MRGRAGNVPGTRDLMREMSNIKRPKRKYPKKTKTRRRRKKKSGAKRRKTSGKVMKKWKRF